MTAYEHDWGNVPRGVYCKHGQRLLVPATDDPYPDYAPADPWPCAEDGCSLADLERQMEAEDAEYWQALADEVAAMQR